MYSKSLLGIVLFGMLAIFGAGETTRTLTRQAATPVVRASDVTSKTLPHEPTSRPTINDITTGQTLPSGSTATPTPQVIVLPMAGTVVTTSSTVLSSPTVIANRVGNKDNVPKEVIDKSLVLEMALFLYASDHKRYPPMLEELYEGQRNYIRDASQMRGVKLSDFKTPPPQGYQWFYDVTSNGKNYLLGLTPKDQFAVALDPKMPIVCSLEQNHLSLIMPGPTAKQMVLRYRENQVKDLAP